ncbi:glucanase [Leptospira sp. 2 VSF19]|uniref:Glucanase n=1 Tax=Leptospira soteropolitanensis TaxID=2950025 RepID=A0AAW5V7A6_9LEPT|nr:LamG-like jellyroll fold domain-containing protein [Leptospira soteropolitanensis]MCW7491183.1 glucanase [Leptospira soteropolitanensis]MCW7498767.1 glucanase [Leptospira soteropolitanensis]MCW7521640.1 glucanase [Leptospira soteropolitanensis]MCW7524871.1 glucanase [Leptospira soteropolitanensis]MCW7528738.1 glucanase [Leptospira soteropolitanensis]
MNFLQKILVYTVALPLFACQFPNINRSFLETFSTIRFLQTNTLSYTVSFRVSGLLGSGLQIENNGDVVNVSANQTYTFSKKIPSGSAYNVIVKTQPTSPIQKCIVSSGSGTVLNGNIEGIQIVCGDALYLIYGSVTGLLGNGLQIQNTTGSGTEVTNVNSSSFSLPPIPSGETYNFSIISQPTNPSQTCSITSPGVTSGTMAAAHLPVAINCVTNSFAVNAQVTGILGTLGAGNELKLTLDGSNTINVTADGTFVFPGTYLSGGTFSITVDNPGGIIPTGVCTLSSGTITVANGTYTIPVNCSNAFLISGTVSSPGGTTTSVLSGTVTLDLVNTGGTPFVTQQVVVYAGISNFSFPATIPGGSDYEIVVSSSAPDQVCTMTAGATHTGTTSDQGNAILNCSLPTPNFTPATGTVFNDDATVTLSALIPGSEYRYTLGNGGQASPTCSTGSMTTNTVSLADTNQAVIKAIHCKTGWVESAVVTSTYTLKVATPTPSLATGSLLNSGDTISFSTTTTGTTWVCKESAAGTPTDPVCGSTANTCSSGTAGNFVFPTPGSSQNVKARMCKENYVGSDILSLNYQPNVYTVGGTISTLTLPFGVNTFVLQNNAGDDLIIAGNGTFTFNTAIPTGSNYAVTVLSGPQNPWQTCNITNGTGTIAAAAITNIAITCSVNNYSMSGNITSTVPLPAGLTVTNGIDSINVPGGATTTPISFATPIASGTNYDISITAEPPGYVCAIQSNYSGTVLGTNITNVAVNCVVGYRYANTITAKKPAPLQIHYYRGLVGTAAGQVGSGSADATGTSASFSNIRGITYDGTKGYIVDYGNHKIRVFNPTTSAVTTLVGNGIIGNTPGSGSVSALNGPRGITTDGTYLYVTEIDGNRIKRILISTGYAETFAGDNTTVTPSNGNVDSTDPLLARFANPAGIVIDDDKLYIAERGNSSIRVMKLRTKEVSTLSIGGNLDQPEGLTVVGDYIYAVNIGTHNITKTHKVTGATTIFAGSSSVGFVDGLGTSASFNMPHGITHDGTFLYVADYGNLRIRRVHITTGEVITIAGSGGSSLTDGEGVNASLNAPMYISNIGNILVVGTTHALRTINSSGLTAYFPLNGSTSNLLNNQTLTAVGSPGFGLGRYGETNGAANLSIGNAATAPSPSASTTDITMSAWIHWDGTSTSLAKMIAYNGSPGTDGYGIFISSESQLGILRGGYTPDPIHINIIPSKWTHVAMTVDSNNVYRIYMNGNLAFQKQMLTNSPTGDLSIGVASLANYFPGRIADFRFYSRVLNEAEINDLARSADSTLVGNSYASRPIELLMQYEFNGNLNPSGPLGNTLVLYGGLSGLAPGRDRSANTSIRLVADNLGYANGIETGLPMGQSPRSVCVWIHPERYPVNANQNSPIFSYGAAGGNTELILSLFKNSGGSNLVRFGGLGSGEVFSSYSVPLNQWSHICGTFDGSVGTIYINGTVIAGPSVIGGGVNTTPGSGIYAGKMVSDGSYFAGKMADLRIYSKALDPKEVRLMSAQIPVGLVARFDFNGSLQDASGMGNQVSNMGVGFSTDRFGNAASAISTNGTNYLSVSTTDTQLPNSNKPRTICVHYKSQLTNPGTIVSYGMASVDRLTSLGSGSAGSKYLFGGFGNDVEGLYYNHENTWHQLCGVFHGPANGNLAMLYDNGVLLQTNVKSAWDTLPLAFTIGTRTDFATSFTGSIDELLIYNRALSTNEIQALSGYDPRQVPSWSPTLGLSSLVLHLSADSLSNQGNGTDVTTWHDRSGYDASFFNGTVPPTFNNVGYNGKPSVNFNAASSQYLIRSPATDIPSNDSSFFLAFSRTNNVDAPILESASVGVSYHLQSNRIHMSKPGFGDVGYSNPVFTGTLVPYLVYFNQSNGVSFQFSSNMYNSGITVNPAQTYSQNNLYLGTNESASNFFSGHISEVIYYKTSLNATGKAIVFCYLSQKYNVDLVIPAITCD